MNKAINIHEAKTHFSKLIERVLYGEEIIIQKAGRPVARLVPLENKVSSKRIAGRFANRIELPKGVEKPLPADEVNLFYR